MCAGLELQIQAGPTDARMLAEFKSSLEASNAEKHRLAAQAAELEAALEHQQSMVTDLQAEIRTAQTEVASLQDDYLFTGS